MARYRAAVTFILELDDVRDGGRRFRELTDAAESVGFTLEGGRIDPAPPEDRDDEGWTAYAPLDS